MSKVQVTGKGEGGGRITRRRLFQWALALAGSAGLQPISPASARPLPPDGDLPLPVPPSSRQPQPSVSYDIPLRSPEEAIKACLVRRSWEERRGIPQPSPLDLLLGNGSLADSRLGLANWPILDEAEDLHLGHFTFPISPYTTMADDGKQRFLLLSNTNIIANFRQRDYLEQIHRRMFDRAVWAMAAGRVGTATIEFDRGLTDVKAGHILRLLAQYGVKTIVWGNEPNSPYAPWRDNLPELLEILFAAAQAKRQYGLTDIDLSLPGLAYYGQGEYLQKMLRALKEAQKRGSRAWPWQSLPIERVADHYYGPVEEFLPRIKKMRDIMAQEGVGSLKYDLTEAGNPTIDPDQQKASDNQLAECHIPQLSSMAVASGLVDRFYYYSLLGSNYEDSLTLIDGGRLAKRSSYSAFLTMAKLLARLDKVSLAEEKDLVRVEGSRTDGVDFTVVWSKLPDRDLVVALPKGKRVFDAFGQEVKGDKPDQVVLKPKQHPSLAGPARIILSGRS